MYVHQDNILIIVSQCLRFDFVLNPSFIFATRRRISQYSPSDTTKQYEKSASKKSISTFNPKPILKRLKEEPEPDLDGVEDLRPKIDLINQYLNVS